MTYGKIVLSAPELIQRIKSAGPKERIQLQPQLTAYLSELEENGEAIPLELRELEAALVEEVVEDRFDNMPV